MKNSHIECATERCTTTKNNTNSLAFTAVSRDQIFNTGTTEGSIKKRRIIEKKKPKASKIKLVTNQKKRNPNPVFARTMHAFTSRTSSATPLKLKMNNQIKKEQNKNNITYDSDQMNEDAFDEQIVQEEKVVEQQKKPKLISVSDLNKQSATFKRHSSMQVSFRGKNNISSLFKQSKILENDVQTVSIDKNIDLAIESVAQRVHEKETLVEKGNRLRDRIYTVNKINDNLQKVKTQLSMQVKKEDDKRWQIFNKNNELREEILKYKKQITTYKTQVQLDIDCQEQKRDSIKQQLDGDFKVFQNELNKVIEHLRGEQNLINDLTNQFTLLEQERFDLTKQINQSIKLENQRVRLMRTKSKVMESVISESKLTKRFGDRASHSPIGRKVQELVKGRKYY